MKIDDLSLGIVVLLGAVALLVSALQFSPIPGQAYGAETMPNAIGLAGLTLGLVLVVRALRDGARRPGFERADWTRTPRALATLALTLALVVIYIAFSDVTGFIPMAFGILVVLMLALGVRAVVALPVALCAAVLVQLAFGRLLLVPLPRNGFIDGLF